VREKDIMSECKHSNIVGLYEVFSDEESLYFVLEVAENGSMS
jgi:serine/threonine protein kinase